MYVMDVQMTLHRRKISPLFRFGDPSCRLSNDQLNFVPGWYDVSLSILKKVLHDVLTAVIVLVSFFHCYPRLILQKWRIITVSNCLFFCFRALGHRVEMYKVKDLVVNKNISHKIWLLPVELN